jgi:hypothetical protein
MQHDCELLLILFRELRRLCSVASDATLIHTALRVLQSILVELGFVAHLYPVVRAVGELKYCAFAELDRCAAQDSFSSWIWMPDAL